MMITKIRTILSGTSLTEREFDKCTKELCDLFNVSVSNFDLKELRSDLVASHSMIGEIVEGSDEGKNLLESSIKRLDSGSYSR